VNAKVKLPTMPEERSVSLVKRPGSLYVPRETRPAVVLVVYDGPQGHAAVCRPAKGCSVVCKVPLGKRVPKVGERGRVIPAGKGWRFER
jgi:hypothetical protein